MTKPLENLLREMHYPGRFIILGRDPTCAYNIAVYGITSKRESGRARVLEPDSPDFPSAIHLKATSEAAQERVYTPVYMDRERVAVGNGIYVRKKIQDADRIVRDDGNILDNLGFNPLDVLTDTFKDLKVDPKVNTTPRIGGILTYNGAALAIVKLEGSETIHLFSTVPLVPGKGKFLSTYDGLNSTPYQNFDSVPIDVQITATNAEQLKEQVYDSLAPWPPKVGNDDLRVGVAVVYLPVRQDGVPLSKRQIAIKNRLQTRELSQVL